MRRCRWRCWWHRRCSSWHRLPNGAWLIDTPGIRELQLIDAAQGVDDVFEDVALLAATCRFSNCAHASEPGCAVQAALAAGTLDAPRLKRFQKLQAEERQNTNTVARSKRQGRLAKRER